MSGPVALSSASRLTRSECDDDRDAREGDAEPQDLPRAEPVEAGGRREEQRHSGCQRHHQRGDARRRMARPDVQEQVVPDDDEEPGRDQSHRVAAGQAGKTACPPEDEREAGRRDGVAEDGDVTRSHPVVE